MIKNLIKAAAELDSAGFHVEADLMDKIMQKVAEKMDPEEELDSEEDMDSEEEEEDLQGSDFGFMDKEEEEEHEEGQESKSVEECLSYCESLSNEEKIELIKAILNIME
jgi:hypothetical protein